MELGGMSLYDYFEHNDKVIKEEDGGREIFSERRQELLTNIFKCAAKALQQFHEFAIHLDIKGINFVITKGQNPDNPLEMCKLIDFNSSIISKDNEHKIVKSLAGYRFALAPEIEEIANKGLKVNQKVDVWAFGIMMITMMSFRVKNPDRDPNLVNANELNLPEQILEYKHIIEHDLETYIQKASFNTNLDLALKVEIIWII
uniref:Protein kinase domain-containing protein n=1 Tax=Meloidogyne hapla TaxID=6305 RepID=A0A1I8BAC1_MELHA